MRYGVIFGEEFNRLVPLTKMMNVGNHEMAIYNGNLFIDTGYFEITNGENFWTWMIGDVGEYPSISISCTTQTSGPLVGLLLDDFKCTMVSIPGKDSFDIIVSRK